jgi:hypothetical protein
MPTRGLIATLFKVNAQNTDIINKTQIGLSAMLCISYKP